MQREGYPAITNKPRFTQPLLKTMQCLGFMRINPVSNNALMGAFLIHLAYSAVYSQLNQICHAVTG